jgi:DNA-binding XRE family transcriptional regulator
MTQGSFSRKNIVNNDLISSKYILTHTRGCFMNNSDALRQTLAQQIVQRRKTAGFTQLELSQRASIAQGYLSEIENSQCNPSLDVLCRIAHTLNCQAGELLL